MNPTPAPQGLTDAQVDAILLAAGTTGQRQVWFTRAETVAAVRAAGVSPIQPAVGGMTDQQIRDRVDALDAERSALMDEYCRRWPAGVVDAEDMAWALASASPAQTGEPVTCGHGCACLTDCGDYYASNGLPKPATGGVDQAWVDKAMELAIDFGVESLRVGSHERKDNILNNGVASWETVRIREKRLAVREALRTHLSTALGAKGKS